jgi:hypothetical protein
MGLMVLDYETPVVGQPYRPPARETLGTPARIGEPPERVAGVTQGTATIDASDETDEPGYVTPIERELKKGQPTAVMHARAAVAPAPAPSDAGPTNEVDRVAEQRAILLAKRYEMRHLSREQEIRLEMLNERLKVLLPPVTEAELMLLEQMAVQVKNARDRIAEIKRRFGLA